MLAKVNQHLHRLGFYASAVAVLRNLIQGRTDQPLADSKIAIHAGSPATLYSPGKPILCHFDQE